MKKAGWDTETGYAMFVEGKKDSEIADAFGIKRSIVTVYRKRHWEGGAPKNTLEMIRPSLTRTEDSAAAAAVTLPATVAEAPVPLAQAEPEGQAAQKPSMLAGMVPIQELIEKVKSEQTTQPAPVAVDNNQKEENNSMQYIGRMELKDTAQMMTSEDYKERFKAEYYQTKIRYEKLRLFNTKIEAARLTQHGPGKTVDMPEHDCPAALLQKQQDLMGEYLEILELRAVIEEIQL